VRDSTMRWCEAVSFIIHKQAHLKATKSCETADYRKDSGLGPKQNGYCEESNKGKSKQY
jgi:hypothetical protein